LFNDEEVVEEAVAEVEAAVKGAEAAAAGEGRSKQSFKEDLLKAFDLVDEDGAGLAPRLDLRKKVDEFVPLCADVQQLSDSVRGLDAMIVEREEYEDLVEQWMSA